MGYIPFVVIVGKDENPGEKAKELAEKCIGDYHVNPFHHGFLTRIYYANRDLKSCNEPVVIPGKDLDIVSELLYSINTNIPFPDKQNRVYVETKIVDFDFPLPLCAVTPDDSGVSNIRAQFSDASKKDDTPSLKDIPEKDVYTVPLTGKS